MKKFKQTAKRDLAWSKIKRNYVANSRDPLIKCHILISPSYTFEG